MAEPVVNKLIHHAKLISKPVIRRTLLTEASESTSIALSEMKQSAASRGEASTAPRSLHDLPGPKGYPIVGTIPEYIRKKNWGQSHEVQVSASILVMFTFQFLFFKYKYRIWCTEKVSGKSG